MQGPVAIVGYMGSGKTTVGRILARTLGRELVDLDRAVVKEAGCTIPEIFERSGEGHFRDLEHRALLTALERERVVTCGGGVVVRSENREALRKVPTVFLQEDLGILYGRTRSANRPLRAASREEFERRYLQRLPLYEEVADLKIAVRGRPPGEVAREIDQWLLGA